MVERNIRGRLIEYRKKEHRFRFRKATLMYGMQDLKDMAFFHNIDPKFVEKAGKINLINEINHQVALRNRQGGIDTWKNQIPAEQQ